MPTELHRLSAVDAAKLLATREISAERYLRALLERIDAREPDVRAFAYLGRDQALAAARALDAGPIRGPLHGLAVGIKDIFDTFDMPTQGGSEAYRGHQPTIDAAAVALTRRAGGIIIGKTVTTELATFPPNETRNPHNLAHTPGGSSSGSAAAVADRMIPLATGTQTLGSVIRPGAYCGVIAYKPTFNLIPRKGTWNSSDSNDTVGVYARSVPDAALYVSAMINYPGLRISTAASGPRIGLCRTYEWDRASAPMQQALENAGRTLAAAGAQVNDVTLPPAFAGLLAAHTLVAQRENGLSFADEWIRSGAKLRPALYERCIEGIAVPGEAYQRAIALGRQCRAMLGEAFGDCDVLLAPAATGEAPLGLEKTGDPGMNQVWTFLHVPLVSIQAGVGPAGLPLGLQVAGRLDDDARTLSAAHWIDRALGFSQP